MDKSKYIGEWDITDNIGIITMNNPPKNLLAFPDFTDLDELKKQISNENIKGLIITGKNRHFSAGADKNILFELALDENMLKEKMKKGAEILKYIEELPIPIIAAINGACFGGGLEIALCAHIRICGKNSFFSFPETDLNIIPGFNGTYRLPDIIGKNKALEMILSGEIINSEKALEIQLVDYIFEPNEVMDAAIKLIKKMTENRSIEVINAVVKSLNNYKKLSLKEAMDEELKMFTNLAVKEAKNIFKKN